MPELDMAAKRVGRHHRHFLPTGADTADTYRRFLGTLGEIPLLLWSRGVTRWVRCGLAVSDPFVCRCLNSLTMLPFSHPAHRTGQAHLAHPALGERLTVLPTESCLSGS